VAACVRRHGVPEVERTKWGGKNGGSTGQGMRGAGLACPGTARAIRARGQAGGTDHIIHTHKKKQEALLYGWLLCGTAKAGVCTNAHGSLFLILGDGSRGESGLYGKKRETGGCSGAPLGGAYPPIHGRGARGRYIHNRPVGCGRRRTKNRGGPSLALDRDPKGRSLDAATAPPRHRQRGPGPCEGAGAGPW
jgi:hypothetical protein